MPSRLFSPLSLSRSLPFNCLLQLMTIDCIVFFPPAQFVYFLLVLCLNFVFGSSEKRLMQRWRIQWIDREQKNADDKIWGGRRKNRWRGKSGWTLRNWCKNCNGFDVKSSAEISIDNINSSWWISRWVQLILREIISNYVSFSRVNCISRHHTPASVGNNFLCF